MATVDDRALRATGFKRRTALHALWATPVVLAATATPAFAASLQGPITFTITQYTASGNSGKAVITATNATSSVGLGTVTYFKTSTQKTTTVSFSPNTLTSGSTPSYSSVSTGQDFQATTVYTIPYTYNGQTYTTTATSSAS